MRPTVARDIYRAHAAEVLQIFQTLARGAFAEIETFDERVHRQWPGRNEEETVDFRHGPRLAERAGELHEEMNDFDLDRLQFGARRIRPGSLFQFFSERQIHLMTIWDWLICSRKNEQKIQI